MFTPEPSTRGARRRNASAHPAAPVDTAADSPANDSLLLPLPVQEVRHRLLSHYDLLRRDLPWRNETDPYRIWVSEVMLQQTRVETVIPYYRRWLERFPDLEALASSDEDDVLALWEGLGYYARARNLLRAARVIRERHAGTLPRELADLRALPGFGSYTTGAVASIAFGVPAAAVDGNVRRVLCRLFDLPAPSAAELGARADLLVDPQRPGDFNQALMELGATLCTPRAPRCSACPLERGCLAAARGTVQDRPVQRLRGPVPERTIVVFALVDSGGRTLLVRRPRSGLLGGLWTFPEHELVEGLPSEDALEATLRALTGPGGSGRGAYAQVEPLAEVRHAFTHFRARYLPRIVHLEEAPGLEAPPGAAQADLRWVEVAAPGLALPAAQKRIMASLNDWLVSRQPSPRRPP